MKILTTILLTCLTLGQIFGQTDKNGNPVFNSVSTNEKAFDDFLLISNYYTLKNNLENSQSSVFISEKPLNDFATSIFSRLENTEQEKNKVINNTFIIYS